MTTAAAFVQNLLEEALGQVVQAKAAVDVRVLERFTHVYIADCSVIALPDELHSLCRGTGGGAGSSRAALKIGTCSELKTGHLHYGLLQGKHSDNRSPLAEADYAPGSLRLQDLAFQPGAHESASTTGWALDFALSNPYGGF